MARWKSGTILRARAALLAVAAATILVGCSDPEAAKHAYFERGNRYFDEEKYAEAIIEYRNAVRQDNRFGEARLKLAEAYVATGNASGALDQFVRAADLLPEDTSAQLKATGFLILAQRWEDAKTRVEKVVSREPENVEAQVLLGTALAGLKEFDAAVAEIEDAINLDPTRGATYANLGAVRAAQGRRDEARAAFQRAVEIEPDSVAAWLALANFQLSSGVIQQAETSLQKVLSLDSGNLQAHRALAAVYISTNRASDAERHLKALVDSTSAAWARFALADFYLRAERLQDAQAILRPLVGRGQDSAGAEARLAQIAYFEKQTLRAHSMLDDLLARQPRNVPVILLKARWLAQEGKTADALDRVKVAVAADPASAPAQYLLGSLHLASRNHEAATVAFTEALRLNPRASAAQLQLSRLLLVQGDAETAVQHADAVLKAVPGNPDARVALARGLIARRELRRADAEVSGLIKQYPKAAVVHALHGTLLRVSNNHVAARAAYERALAIDARSLEAISGIVSSDVASKRTAQARAFLDSRLSADPGWPELHVLSARLHGSQREFDRAEMSVRKAIDLDATNASAYAMLAQLLLTQNRLDDALKEFDQIAAREPSNLGAATMAAMIVEAQKKMPEAKKRYAAIVASNPRAAVAANNLAWIYAEEGENLSEALTLARTAVSIMPDRPEAQDTLGWVYYKSDQPGLAIAPFEQSIARDGTKAVYHYHLALALSKTGDAERARKSAEAAVELDPNLADARRLLESLKS